MIFSIIIGGAVAGAAPPADPCKGFDTISMAKCMDGKIEQASVRLRVYRMRAVNLFKEEGHDLATAKAIENAGTAFDAYKEIYCGAVYQASIGGTIRYALHQSCGLKLIDTETHRIWEDFLTPYQRPALLPEPKPTE